MNALVDTHCHFNHEKLELDTHKLIERAQTAGVQRMIVVGYDLESSSKAVDLASEYTGVLFAAVGIHPHEASSWNADTERQIVEMASKTGVVAIGEFGLDYYRNLSPKDRQIDAMLAQKQIADQFGLPVIIHCRDAYDELIALFENEGAPANGGVMHCWAGSVQQANRVVEMGFALGFGGVVTYPSAEELRECAKAVPPGAILLETDAPYLPPVPYRGKRNEPSYVALVAEKVASVRGMGLDDLAALTTSNAVRVFPGLNTN